MWWANCKKWTKKFQKNVKIKSSNFWQNYFFLKAILLYSTRESKYFRNYMQPNFVWFQKIVLYMTMPKWSDRLPMF